LRKAHIQGTESHIIGDRRHEQLIVRVLKHHADGAADHRERFGGHGKIPDSDFAGSGLERSGQMQQKRGFSRAV